MVVKDVAIAKCNVTRSRVKIAGLAAEYGVQHTWNDED